MTIKAILIDSQKETFTEVKITDWRDISPLIGCRNFDCVNLMDMDTHTLYVDDEGMFDLDESSKFMVVKGAYQPFAGNGLILGFDIDSGDSLDCTMTIEDVERMVSFANINQVREMQW